MYPYFLIYSLIVSFALMEFYNFKYFIKNQNIFKFSLFLILLLFMGLKYYVGGDWGTYSVLFSGINNLQINFRNLNNDYGYYFLNLLFYNLGFSFFSINIIAAGICLYGIHLLATRYLNYFLFILILTPYFIFIILMGYTRQSISIGLFLISISLLYKNNNLKNLLLYFFLIFLAFLFHKSSIILFLIPLFTIKINFLSFSILLNLFFAFLLILLFVVFHDRFLDRLEYFFINSYSTTGAYYRTLIIFLFSTTYLILLKRFKFPYKNSLNYIILIITIAICSLICISPSTVIIDRFLLYFYFIIPLFIISIMKHSKNDLNKSIIVYCSIISGFLLMILWFNFATNSNSWVPYQNYLFI